VAASHAAGCTELTHIQLCHSTDFRFNIYILVNWLPLVWRALAAEGVWTPAV